MVRLSGVEFDVLREFGRKIWLGVNGVHRAYLHTRRAIDAFLGMDHDLIVHFVKTSDGTHLHTIGELASVAFISDDVSHGVL